MPELAARDVVGAEFGNQDWTEADQLLRLACPPALAAGRPACEAGATFRMIAGNRPLPVHFRLVGNPDPAALRASDGSTQLESANDKRVRSRAPSESGSVLVLHAKPVPATMNGSNWPISVSKLMPL